jgi:hypothetical protein
MSANGLASDRTNNLRQGRSALRRRLAIGVVALTLGATAVMTPAVIPAAGAQDATPAAGAEAGAEVWVDAVLPTGVLAEGVPRTLGAFRVVWDAGAASRFAGGTPGFGVNCVLDGEWAFRPDEEETVVRAGAGGMPEAAPAGAETIIGVGDCAVLRQDGARDERNAGDGPTELLVVVLIPDETPPPEGGPEPLEFGPLGYVYAGNWSRAPDGPAAPLRFALERATLAPGASRSVPAPAGDALVVVTEGALGLTAEGGEPLVERGVSWTSEMPAPVPAGSETVLATTDTAHVPDGTAVELRNGGDGPATFWLVTIEPLEASAATPAA